MILQTFVKAHRVPGTGLGPGDTQPEKQLHPVEALPSEAGAARQTPAGSDWPGGWEGGKRPEPRQSPKRPNPGVVGVGGVRAWTSHLGPEGGVESANRRRAAWAQRERWRRGRAGYLRTFSILAFLTKKNYQNLEIRQEMTAWSFKTILEHYQASLR